MAINYDKVDVSTGLSTAARLNTELGKIETALQDGLSRSGNGPNAMSADLDLGGNDLLNAGAVQCDSILVGGEQIASVAALAAEADRAEAAAAQADVSAGAAIAAQAAAELAEAGAEAAQIAAELAASSLVLPTISPGDAGKALIVNGTEDGYEYSAPVDPAVAIAAAITDQATAEAGVDNTELMTPLRTKEAFIAHSEAGIAPAGITTFGDVQISSASSVLAAWRRLDPGVATNRAVTAGGLYDAIQSAVSASGFSGQIELGGVILQWGRTERTGSSTDVVFSGPVTTSFPVGVAFVVAQSEDDGGTRTLGNTPNINSVTTAGFNARHGTDFTHIRWFAIGY